MCLGNTVTTINTNPVIKSIYDPSPVGYHLPCTGAFQGWNTRAVWQESGVNRGYGFYPAIAGVGTTVFFHALGHRDNATSTGNVPSFGSYYTAGAQSGSNGRNLDFHNGTVLTDGAFDRWTGRAIRPVKE